ncbi:uncharacterized protein LOC144907029 isoform X2 [Branchiostoma floridae x Branchiostoma belcheri]
MPANKRARTNEVQADNVNWLQGALAKKRRCPASTAPPKRRHLAECLDPRIQPPHYPDPFRPTRPTPVTPPVFHINPFPAVYVPTPAVFPTFAPDPEPMDWQISDYREIVLWPCVQQSEETPMDWE